jgi:hypothetical protein
MAVRYFDGRGVPVITARSQSARLPFLIVASNRFGSSAISQSLCRIEYNSVDIRRAKECEESAIVTISMSLPMDAAESGSRMTTPKVWLSSMRCWSEPRWPPRDHVKLLLIAALEYARRMTRNAEPPKNQKMMSHFGEIAAMDRRRFPVVSRDLLFEACELLHTSRPLARTTLSKVAGLPALRCLNGAPATEKPQSASLFIGSRCHAIDLHSEN